MSNKTFRLLTNSEFKKQFEKQNETKDEKILLRKCFDCEVETKADNSQDTDRRLQFTISTSSPDRENDSISVEGWKLGNFRKSGVVLWAHNSGFGTSVPPIAKPVKIWIENGKLKSIAEFLNPEDYDNHNHAKFSDMIYRMYKNKVMRATSVGFRPIKWDRSDERENGIDFKEHELLEYSCVPVPANPEALEEACTSGIDLTPLKEWTEKELLRTDNGLYVPRETLETLHKELNAVHVTISTKDEKSDTDETQQPANDGKEKDTDIESLKQIFNEIKISVGKLVDDFKSINERLEKVELFVAEKNQETQGKTQDNQDDQDNQESQDDQKDFELSVDIIKEITKTISAQALENLDKRMNQIKGIV